jgi:hypothetical protein
MTENSRSETIQIYVTGNGITFGYAYSNVQFLQKHNCRNVREFQNKIIDRCKYDLLLKMLYCYCALSNLPCFNIWVTSYTNNVSFTGVRSNIHVIWRIRYWCKFQMANVYFGIYYVQGRWCSTSIYSCKFTESCIWNVFLRDFACGVSDSIWYIWGEGNKHSVITGSLCMVRHE